MPRDPETEIRDLVLALTRIRTRASACIEGGGKYAIQTLDAIDEIAEHAIALALPVRSLRQRMEPSALPAPGKQGRQHQ
jgi:hypothetical protein